MNFLKSNKKEKISKIFICLFYLLLFKIRKTNN